MGDYRNELQSALAQIEALRAENAALRARLRPGVASTPREDSDPGLPRPTERAAPPPRSIARQALAVTAGGVLIAAGMTLARPRRAPEVPLRMPDAPAVPVVGPAGPLPMPPTSVRLPERPKPPGAAVHDVVERGPTVQPSVVQSSVGFDHHAHWEDAARGLYVLTTVPDAECSVGGVRFASPRPVFLEPGEYAVRCEAGSTRQRWNVRVAARQVTLDLEHRVGR